MLKILVSIVIGINEKSFALYLLALVKKFNWLRIWCVLPQNVNFSLFWKCRRLYDLQISTE